MKKLITFLLLLLPALAFGQSYPSPTYNNLQVNTGLSIGPVAAGLTKAINTAQTVTGTTSVNCTTTTLIMYPCANLHYVASDNAAAASPTNNFDEWQFAANVGGSTLTGARQILDVIGNFTAPSSASNTNKGYDAITGEFITNSGDGGTAPTTANGAGSFFGMNAVVVANSGATNLFGIAGIEVNAQCNGCTTAIRFGVSAVQNGANQAAVLANDAAFHVGSFQNVGGAWHQALNLSNVNGLAPLDTTGCVICTDSTANTIATGIDLSAYTISGNFLKGPSGFSVTGAGAATIPSGLGITTGGLNIGAGGATIAGGLTVSSGTTSVQALTSTGITGSPISGSTGSFTTLAASSTVSGAGFTSLFASPPSIGNTAANTGAFTTLSATGNFTPSQTNGIVGTTTNNNANAGSVGEYVTATNTATSMTTNTGTNCTSVSLTAGDWDVWGVVSFNAASTTTIQALDLGINTTSATLGGLGTANKYVETFSSGPASDVLSTPVVRESLSGTTTVFVVGLASFLTSTMTCDGFIAARRVR